MDVQELQTVLNSFNGFEITVVLVVSTLLFFLVHYAVQLTKSNTQLRKRMHQKSSDVSSDEGSGSPNAIHYSVEQAKNNIAIKRLEAQVKRQKRQLSLIETLNIERNLRAENKANSTENINHAKHSVQPHQQKKISSAEMKIAPEKRRLMNQQQRAQYHYRVKQAKLRLQKSSTGAGVASSKPPASINMPSEQLQLMSLLSH